ncbi:MarR family winged helix-turn-helix transcriptional regulator [Saccharibacter floricola]|uniref:MarR family transcriptional regulator n=1 Tax=Saccharibacter floricola DSM 15669 TaxID=1123227 RepID=A0ABQ0NVV7_9PROT|nr:MarR family winged helix-turn-helix transcriptional regulator [Saccharibacter floricola]GBQ04586.1 MarR family transcriptional regulator [Saccharibacter floricola DSM 15669]
MALHFSKGTSAAEAHLYLREAPMRQTFEAFMLAWRVLTEACEPVLAEYGLGRAHHRILFFVGSYTDITPSILLKRLGITKQSLGRALGELKAQNLLEQVNDKQDRRRKPIRLTAKGRDVESRLFASVRAVMTQSYRHVDGSQVEGFRSVLAALMSVEDEKSPHQQAGEAQSL